MKIVKWLHKWLSPLVGLQLLIWLGTGLFFKIVGPQWGAGNDYRKQLDTNATCTEEPVAISSLQLNFRPITIELINHLGNCYYLAYRSKTFRQYQPVDAMRFNASTGAIEDAIKKDEAHAIAISSYSGQGSMVIHKFFEGGQTPDDKQKNALWQFEFDDDLNTRVYVHGITGEITHHDNSRSDVWKLMLKLHFMDYFGTGFFNTPLLILFALMSLILTVSGIVWLFSKTFPRKAAV